MQKVIRNCLIVLCILCLLAGVALVLSNVLPRNDESEQVSDSAVHKMTDIKSVVGVTFAVDADWVAEETEYSQCTFYHNLSDYHKAGLNAISVTTSWINDDFDLKGFADTFCAALQANEKTAKAERNAYRIGEYNIEEISVVNNGAFGGYCYLMKGNVVVEILYGTSSPDLLPTYQNDVNNIIKSLTFTEGVKETDFPEPPPESSAESSQESSNVAGTANTESSVGTGESKTSENIENGESDSSESNSTDSEVVSDAKNNENSVE